MDSSIDNDEVIADSEDEGNGLGNTAHVPQTITQDPITITLRPLSSIEDPTTPAYTAQSRPKPRLVKKTIQTHDTNLVPDPNPTFSSISGDTEFSNIADRAKMRSRAKASTQEPSSTIIDLSSDDGDFSNALPPLKKRRTTTAKRNALSSAKTADESAAEVDTISRKPRPRPRPIASAKGSTLSDPITTFSRATDTGFLAISSTSDNHGPIPFKLIPSQLPPSDIPTSTPDSFEHPPIETLPQSSTDFDHPSSPSSLFSAYSHGTRKKGHTVVADVDELASDPSLHNMDVDVQSMPPPTFFAGSSSSPVMRDVPPVGRHGESPPIKAPVPKKSRKKPVIESDGGRIENKVGNSSKKSKSRRKATKKVEVVIEANKKRKDTVEKKQVLRNEEIVNGDDDDDMNLFRDPPQASNGPKGVDLFDSLSSLSESDSDGTRKASARRKRNPPHKNNVDPPQGGHPEVGRSSTTGKKNRRVKSNDGGSNVRDEFSPVKNTNAITKGNFSDASKSNKGQEASLTRANDDVEDREDSPVRMSSKENAQPASVACLGLETPASGKEKVTPSLTSRYSIAPKSKPTPMSDLIRRVNSKPGSPFCSPVPRSATPGTAYSPYVKASRKALSRIAPLHPNRRTPPPPLPPPPPRKKTKKELEREEQWEEELIESVGGITEWACMTDAERKELRKAKIESETHGWED